MLLGETSELSLEPAIEGRFDGSRRVVHSGVAKKYVVPFLGTNHSTRTSGGALCTGADGPWPGAGWFAAWCEARISCLTIEWSTPWGQTVRACVGAAEDRRRRLNLAPKRDPIGEERSYVMSRLGRPT
jgi:hypothetical protein